MTALVTVTLTGVEDDAGAVLGNAWLTVRLVSGGAGATVDGNAVGLRPIKIRTDADGDASFTAYPTASTSPTGTYYTVSVDGSSPLIARSFTIPASGPVEWTACPQVEEPVPPLFWPAVSEGAAGDVATIDSSGQLVEWVPLSDSVSALVGASIAGAYTAAGAAQDAADAAQADATTAIADAATAQGAADAAQADVDTLTEQAVAPVGDGGRSLHRWATTGTPPDTSGTGHFTYPQPTVTWTGFDFRATVRPVASYPGTDTFAELGTCTLDGIGSIDNFEAALNWVQGLPYMMFEWVASGGTLEVIGPQAGATGFRCLPGDWTPPIGQWSTVRVTLELNVGGQWRGRHWRQVFTGQDATTSDGTKWKIIREVIGTTGPTTIHSGLSTLTGDAEPWDVGRNNHMTEIAAVSWRNGIDGTVVAGFDAQDATVSTTIPDSVSGDWSSTGTHAFVAGPVAFDAAGGVALGETSTTAYRGDRGKTAYDYSQAHTGATDPHGDRAYAVQRANHTGTQAATTVTGLPWPSSHCIEPASQRPNTYTTWTPTVGGVFGAGYAAGATTVGGETWTYAGLPMKAGTWALDLTIRKFSAAGIITCAVGGSTVGTVDGYNASNLGDQRSTISAAITVAADGLYDLVFTNPTKGTGVAYGWTIQVIDLRRTGA